MVSSSLVVGPSLKNGPASPPAHHIVIYMALGHHFPARWRYHLVGLAPFSLSPSLARSFAAGVVRRPLPDCTHSLHAHTLAQPCACSVCSPAAPRPEQFVMMCNGREILSLSFPNLGPPLGAVQSESRGQVCKRKDNNYLRCLLLIIIFPIIIDIAVITIFIFHLLVVVLVVVVIRIRNRGRTCSSNNNNGRQSSESSCYRFPHLCTKEDHLCVYTFPHSP